MKILNFIRPKRKSANIAKERLQIIINHERINNKTGDFLPQLRKELIAVLSKYVRLDEELINIQMTKGEKQSMIEMNVVVPTQEGRKTCAKKMEAELETV